MVADPCTVLPIEIEVSMHARKPFPIDSALHDGCYHKVCEWLKEWLHLRGFA